MKKTFFLFVFGLAFNCAIAQQVIVFSYNQPAAPPVIVTGADTAVYNDSSFVLNAQVTQGTAPLSFSWSPGDVLNDSTLLNPTAVINQPTLFRLSVIDSNGCVSVDSLFVDTITIETNPGTSVSEKTRQNIVVYPNPVSDKVFLDGISDPNKIKSIEIYNIMGTQIHFNKSNNGNQIVIDLLEKSAGVYTLIVRYEDELLSKKFIVQ